MFERLERRRGLQVVYGAEGTKGPKCAYAWFVIMTVRNSHEAVFFLTDIDFYLSDVSQ
jgi:hypothetical protein